jgi:head-tail adaptor
MDAGRLNKRIKILRLTKTADGFGGFTSSETIVHTFWCAKKTNRGEIRQENGIREQRTEIEFILRQKAANQILMSDVLQLDATDEKFRIIDMFDGLYQRFKSGASGSNAEDYYTTIKAVTI